MSSGSRGSGTGAVSDVGPWPCLLWESPWWEVPLEGRCGASLGWHEPGCTQPVSPPSDAVPAFPWVGPHLRCHRRSAQGLLGTLAHSALCQLQGTVPWTRCHCGSTFISRKRFPGKVLGRRAASPGVRVRASGRGGNRRGGGGSDDLQLGSESFSLFFSGLKDFLMETATAYFFKKQIVSLTFSYF